MVLAEAELGGTGRRLEGLDQGWEELGGSGHGTGRNRSRAGIGGSRTGAGWTGSWQLLARARAELERAA